VILENTNRCPSAIAHFERAIPCPGETFTGTASPLRILSIFDERVRCSLCALPEGVNVYLQDEASETLYQYAYSAVIVGDVPRASLLLRALLYQTPDAETRLRERAQGLLAQIEADSSLAGTFLDRLVRPLP